MFQSGYGSENKLQLHWIEVKRSELSYTWLIYYEGVGTYLDL